jgi:hypothetical protein
VPHESDNVTGAQPGKRDRSTAEAVFEKGANRRHVVYDRWLS